jgi:hypothetical protein
MQDALSRKAPQGAAWDYNKSLSTDCLAKTQVPANPKKGRIGAETCPVLVSQPSTLTYPSLKKG